MNEKTSVELINNSISKLLEAKKRIRLKLSEEIEYDAAILTRHEQNILNPNTINVIQGKAGSHKSRLVEIISASILSDNNKEDQYLNFLRSHYPAEHFVLLYVDTERNLKDQFPKALQRIIKHSGHTLDTVSDLLDYVSLIPIDRSMRLTNTEKYIEYLRNNHNKHLVIILDVVSHCISDFNHSNESMKLIDYMNVLINEYDVTFICVIHENPSSEDKARGHLGTELRNKASMVIQIGFVKRKGTREDSDIIKVNYLKNRNGRRPESFYTVYDNSKGTLIEVDKESVESIMETSYNQKVTAAEIREILPDYLPCTRQALIEVLMDKFSVSRNTVIKRLNEIIPEKKFTLNEVEYHISQEKKGREVIYNLSWQQKIT